MKFTSVGCRRANRRQILLAVVLLLICFNFIVCTGCIGTAKGTLKLASTPEGAMIYIDDVYMGTTPATVDIPEGVHRIEMRIDGYEEWSHTVAIGAGKTSYFSGTLQKPTIASSTPTPLPSIIPTSELSASPSVTVAPTSVSPLADTESPDEEFFDIIPVYSMKLFGYRNQIGFYSTKGTSVKNYRQMEVTGEILKKTADHYSSNMTKLKVSKTYAIPAARFKSFIDWYAKAGSALMLAAEYNSDREWKLRDIWLEAAENAYQEGDKGYLSVVEQLNLSDLRAT